MVHNEVTNLIEFKYKKYLNIYNKTGIINKELYNNKGINSNIKNLCTKELYKKLELDIATKIALNYYNETIKFDSELCTLYNTLETETSKYKYPSILANYKKNINPVYSIHQELQAALLSDLVTLKTSWIISTFYTEYFLLSVISDINCDLNKICVFKSKYNKDYKYFNKNIKELNKIRDKLEYCLNDFSLMLLGISEKRDLG